MDIMKMESTSSIWLEYFYDNLEETAEHVFFICPRLAVVKVYPQTKLGSHYVL